MARSSPNRNHLHKTSVVAALGGHYSRLIEHGEHWVLDVSFHEDAARQQDRHGSANLGAVRRLIVSLLRQEKTLKRGEGETHGLRSRYSVSPEGVGHR
jgi:predicted transposase YbfD/YdcC